MKALLLFALAIGAGLLAGGCSFHSCPTYSSSLRYSHGHITDYKRTKKWFEPRRTHRTMKYAERD